MRFLRLAPVLIILLLCAAGAPAHAAEPKGKERAETQRSQRQEVVAFVRRQLGKPYVWGATGPRGFDCSGLMLAAYRSVGRTIPRTTSALLARLRPPRELRPGDLVFGLPHHVAMYIGHGQVIHAPAPGRRVEVASVRWHKRYATRTVFRALR